MAVLIALILAIGLAFTFAVVLSARPFIRATVAAAGLVALIVVLIGFASRGAALPPWLWRDGAGPILSSLSEWLVEPLAVFLGAPITGYGAAMFYLMLWAVPVLLAPQDRRIRALTVALGALQLFGWAARVGGSMLLDNPTSVPSPTGSLLFLGGQFGIVAVWIVMLALAIRARVSDPWRQTAKAVAIVLAMLPVAFLGVVILTALHEPYPLQADEVVFKGSGAVFMVLVVTFLVKWNRRRAADRET